MKRNNNTTALDWKNGTGFRHVYDNPPCELMVNGLAMENSNTDAAPKNESNDTSRKDNRLYSSLLTEDGGETLDRAQRVTALMALLLNSYEDTDGTQSDINAKSLACVFDYITDDLTKIKNNLFQFEGLRSAQDYCGGRNEFTQ
ncbi:TPA: hypothetical protein ACJHGT_004588 [Yersinia enterocolitica]|uniref:hypothetical protein n=1 Tax=Yersinia TaxID=629 RepID=UPI0025AB1D8F|nr:hypothetical protein [Yersinia rohdei]HDL8482816.1 hypothetical protein [Yersinia enterocolitica]MDN0094140.1 hypothetical protein [Yersinia rohdei]HEM6620767.1 hypothetical protein [Yersinia enterocolitica]HEN3259736.1 hypothetical protein [Yersinia enterocolitica]HEN3380638.1 hypothetical protein [Yersinia enterocolitica]